MKQCNLLVNYVKLRRAVCLKDIVFGILKRIRIRKIGEARNRTDGVGKSSRLAKR